MNRVRKLLLIALFVGTAGGCLAGEPYVIDKAHTRVAFTVKHMVINKVSGVFHDFSGTIDFDEKDITKSSVSGTIAVTSVDTGNENRDNDLRTNETFFTAAKYPQITFQSKKIVKKDDGYVCTGTLNIRGVSKDIDLMVHVNGPIKDTNGNSRIGIEATGQINRHEYGLTWNKLIESGAPVVSSEVWITIDAEAVKKASDAK